jgi:predicted nucleotidyltransferase component of viral defense system
MLVQILRDIYADSRLGPRLGFKGGTAAYLVHQLPRFSVDLDFDLLDASQEADVFTRLTEVLGRKLRLTEQRNKKYTLFWLGSYIAGLRQVKVEVSKRPLQSGYEIKSYLGFSLLVMKPEDMFAHKLLALLGRKRFAARDLFDVWFFLNNNWDINPEIIRLGSGLTVKDYLKKSLQFVQTVDNRDILSGLGELLEPKMKIWVKAKLKDEVLFLLKLNCDLEK